MNRAVFIVIAFMNCGTIAVAISNVHDAVACTTCGLTAVAYRDLQDHRNRLSRISASTRLLSRIAGAFAVALGNSCDLRDRFRKLRQTRMEIAMEAMAGR